MSNLWRGILIHAFIVAAWQDWLGLDAYIERCKTGWTHFPSWMAFVWLALAVVTLATARREKQERTDYV